MPADCDVVVALLVAQMREHRVPAEPAQLRKVLVNVMEDDRRGFILVSKDVGTVVGVAYVATILSVEHGGPVGWLEELYVTPRCRGQGIGAALLVAVLERARQVGMVAIDLEVDVEHQRAESLYRRFGFHSLPRSRWAKKIEN
jgi:GNAT superfamily N-acetyltransferase